MKKIKLCVIGAGDHARRFIYPSLNTIPDLEIVAVCTRTAATAQAAARKYGIPRAYTNYREMLEKENPDGTVIVGPPSLHCQAGMACIERKIPFFCEKPSAPDAAGAETLAAAARNAGVFGQVGFMMRHAAFFRELEKIRATAGDPVYGTVNYLTSGPYRHDVIYGMPGVEDSAFLHRYLLVQAVHPVNFATAFLGRIRSIDSYVRFSGAEDLVVEILLEDHDNRRFRVLLHTLVAPGYGNLRFQSELFFADRTMLFTDGFDKFDEYYEKGYIKRIVTTNLNYRDPELLKKPYYTEADMTKFLATIIDTLNHDTPVGRINTPTEKIRLLLEKQKAGIKI